MHPALRVAAATLLGTSALRAQQRPATPTPDSTAPAPIEDNSFLVEEAYNQEFGVVQHISTFQHDPTGHGWLYTFTQEWPVPGQRHQLSYTVPLAQADVPGASPRLGDLALNYRFQARDRGGVLFAPRLSMLLPTGSWRADAGTGGVGLQGNLPLTLELSRQWVTHSNVGGTLVPRGRAADDQRRRLSNVTLGQSVIFLPSPTFNLMLETVWSRTDERIGAVDQPREQSLVVSPGLRFAINTATRSGLQIVPGLAFPVTVTGRSGDFQAETGVFVYLSFEHAFRH